jgi:HEAT repeat protein
MLSGLDDLSRIEYYLELRRGENGFMFLAIHTAFGFLPGQYYLDHLSEFLANGSPQLRHLTLSRIDSVYTENDFPKLSPYANDPDARVRLSIASLQYKDKPELLYEYILENYDTFPDDIKCSVVNGLSYTYKRSCLEIYYKAISDTCLELQVLGIKGLQYCNDSVAINIIYGSLNDTKPEIQIAALNAASQRVNSTLGSYAYNLLDSPHMDVRIAAISALREIYSFYNSINELGNYRNIPERLVEIAASHDTAEVRLRALRVLNENVSEIYVDKYPKLIYDPDPRIRSLVAEQMGRSREYKYIKYLDKALKNETDRNADFSIQQAIIMIYLAHPKEKYSRRVKAIIDEVEIFLPQSNK